MSTKEDFHTQYAEDVDPDTLGEIWKAKEEARTELVLNYSKKISTLSPVKSLLKLQTLEFRKTEVKDLSPLAEMQELRKIVCSETGIKDLAPLRKLKNLERLHCSGTEISDLAPLAELPKLRLLSCYNTHISDLSPLRLLIEKGLKVEWSSNSWEGEGIYVEGCPLVHPPIEIVKQGNEAILAYFEELKKVGEEKSLEAKVVLIGEGMAGKTSLRTRLIKGEKAPLPPKDERTKGLEVEVEPFFVDLPNGERIRLNLFDFGGQKHYKPLHQFFYSCRALYVLVTKNGDDSNEFDYWFSTAELFGEKSPVLVVNNLFGDVPSGFSRSRFGRFDHIIKDSLDTNLDTCAGFPEVKKRIGQLAEDLPTVLQIIPKSWANVRRALEKIRYRNIIPLDEYLEICAQEENGGMDESRALHCSLYLHDIGVCLHYPEKDFPGLHRFVIVRNEWATEAVYRVMEDKTVNDQHGRFNLDDMRRIWQPRQEDIEQGENFRYERYRPELLELMRNFKLCYPLKDGESYVAPSLLPVKQEDDLRWNADQDLQFEVEYDFMPPALFSRFVVSRYEDIGGDNRNQVWKDEVFFQWENARANVSVPSRVGKNAIVFKVQGKDLEARKLLLTSLLRDLTELHKETPGIKVEERIPCICVRCSATQEDKQFFEHTVLKEFQAAGDDEIQCQKSRKMVSVNALLGNIFSTREGIGEDDSQEILGLIEKGRLEEALERMKEAGYPDAIQFLGQLNRAKKKVNVEGGVAADLRNEENRIQTVVVELVKKHQTTTRATSR
ncbi:MAG: COR domain-containing protein [Saprospiraceae bacterium]